MQFYRRVLDRTSHTISAPSPQKIGDTPYLFTSWSDGGAQTHIITPSSALTFTANFSVMSGSCYTLAYGGIGGDPNNVGAYISWISSTYRMNGNEVYMHSNTVLSGPNAGVMIPHVTTYYYRNGSLISTYNATSSYGSSVNGDQYQVLYSGVQYYLGTFQLGSVASSQNDHWGTSPVCESLGYPVASRYIHYADSSNTYVASKPTIVGPNDASGVPTTNAAIWYLGGAPSIDGYYTQTTLTGNANWGPSPAVQWAVVQRPDKVTLSASLAKQVTATSQEANAAATPGTYDWDVQIQVTTDGLPSDPFPMSINAPWRVSGHLVSTLPNPNGQGFVSDFNYLLYDVAYLPINVPITLHETIENCLTDDPLANWCTIAVAIATWDPTLWTSGTWDDCYYAWNTGLLSPLPQNPGSPTLGTTLEMNKTQKWFVGAPGDPTQKTNIFTGLCVQSNKIQFYLDHGDRQNITTPVAAASCAKDVFVNP